MAPLVIHILLPYRTNVSPSRWATAFIPNTSVPASGSLMHIPPTSSPLHAPGR